MAAQLRGYSLADPEPTQQQALPAAVVEELAKATESHRAIGQLVVGAFFFATCSCKYSEASGSPRTKTLRIGDIIFRLGGEPIRSVDKAVLASANTASVTYRTQKNGQHGEQGWAGRIGVAHIGVQPRQGPLGGSGGGTIEPCGDGQNGNAARATTITAGEVLVHLLRAAAIQYGEAWLGFPVTHIETHSLRAGAAMAMFLAGVLVETIQLIG